MIASMQPPHPPGAMDFPLEPTVSRIGRKRWPLRYAWRTLKDAGARIVFASDWPVSPIDPIAGMQAAMLRKPWADDMPDQSFYASMKRSPATRSKAPMPSSRSIARAG